MKLNFKFSNLCGVVYKKGKIIFTPDGNTLLSPVGNRITAFDLYKHTSFTLPIQTRTDIQLLAISPDGVLLLAVDIEGAALLINYPKQIVLAPFHFKKRVYAIQFSPSGTYFAATHSKYIQVWKTPGKHKEFAPFVLAREYLDHTDDTTCVNWSQSEAYILSGSKDLNVSIRFTAGGGHTRYRESINGQKRSIRLTGHRSSLVNVFFSKNDRVVYSVSKDGVLYVWRYISQIDESKVDDENSEEEKEVEVDLTEQNGNIIESSTHPIGISNQSADCSSQSESISHKWSKSNEDIINEEEESGHEENFEKYLDQLDTLGANHGYWEFWTKYFFWDLSTARVYAAQFHVTSDLLVVGFDNGVFGLYDLKNLTIAASSTDLRPSLPPLRKPSSTTEPELELTPTDQPPLICIQKLTISSEMVDTLDINSTGEWLAFGISQLGQILVWEWQSERYILKQQGHTTYMSSLAYSPEGQYLVTGGKDGKIKVWNTSTGFCFVTFKDHLAAVNDVKFSPRGQLIVSASTDGTVRAYDMVRYRNFRIMTAPETTQFSCVAIDPAGEVVAAGTMADFSVYIWSLQTGKLLDTLKGHEGPLAQIAFSPQNPQLVTASWDGTVKIWEIYSGNRLPVESLVHSTDCTALCLRSDGQQICVATIDGMLSFWNPLDGALQGVIDARRDINVGRSRSDYFSAKNNPKSQYFTCCSYSADGSCIIAGGNSRLVCIYHVGNRILLKKFQTSKNRALEGIVDYLDSRKTRQDGTAYGNYDQDEVDTDDEIWEKKTTSLPGVQSGADMRGDRQNQGIQIMTTDIVFSPNNRQWACTTTTGLLIYSLDELMTFDPYMLDLTITPDTIYHTFDFEKNYLKALVMALRLNEYDITSRIFDQMPSARSSIALMAEAIQPVYFERLATFLAIHMEHSPRVHQHMLWVGELLKYHGEYIKNNLNRLLTSLRHLQKQVLKHSQNIQELSQENLYWLNYIPKIKLRSELKKPEQVEKDELLEMSVVARHQRNKEKEKLNDIMIGHVEEKIMPNADKSRKRKV